MGGGMYASRENEQKCEEFIKNFMNIFDENNRLKRTFLKFW